MNIRYLIIDKDEKDNDDILCAASAFLLRQIRRFGSPYVHREKTNKGEGSIAAVPFDEREHLGAAGVGRGGAGA